MNDSDESSDIGKILKELEIIIARCDNPEIEGMISAETKRGDLANPAVNAFTNVLRYSGPNKWNWNGLFPTPKYSKLFLEYLSKLSIPEQHLLAGFVNVLSRYKIQPYEEEIERYKSQIRLLRRNRAQFSLAAIVILTSEGIEEYFPECDYLEFIENSKGTKQIAMIGDSAFTFMSDGKVKKFGTGKEIDLGTVPADRIVSNSSMAFVNRNVALDKELNIVQPLDPDFPTHFFDATDEYLLGKSEEEAAQRIDGGFRLVKLPEMKVVVKGHADEVYDGVIAGKYFFVAHGKTKVYEARDILTGKIVKETDISAAAGASAFAGGRAFIKGLSPNSGDTKTFAFDQDLNIMAEDYTPPGEIRTAGDCIVNILKNVDNRWIPILVQDLNLRTVDVFFIEPKGEFNPTDSRVYILRE